MEGSYARKNPGHGIGIILTGRKGTGEGRHVPTCVKALGVGNDKCQTDKTRAQKSGSPSQHR